ncbi:MAG: polysaccharide deacetylase family protein [Calditrichia bacterium]
MKRIFILELMLLVCLLGCDSTPEQDHIKEKVNDQSGLKPERPIVSFTFDDGLTSGLADYPFEEWNGKILESLANANLKAIFFVTGSNKTDKRGHELLQSWSNSGHLIANHTWSHPNFSSEKHTAEEFARQLSKTDSVISQYETYSKLFRFPYLKEGKTRQKVDAIRNVLSENGYRNGYVTIDASDWYVNSRLIKRIKKAGREKTDFNAFRDFYLKHILERALYYEDLSFELTGRHIPHSLLLHHNLTSALFLDELIAHFKANGWQVIDADAAYEDNVYSKVPTTIPSGESLIWSLAKESGLYDHKLRYPAEDSRYEKATMDKLGL